MSDHLQPVQVGVHDGGQWGMVGQQRPRVGEIVEPCVGQCHRPQGESIAVGQPAAVARAGAAGTGWAL